MAKKNTKDLTNDKNAALPDNTVGSITPAVTRGQQQDIIDSLLNTASGNVEQTIESPVNFTGGLKTDGNVISFGQNIITVNSVDDFPSAVANVITLAASTTYILSGNIDIGADRLVLPVASALVGHNRFSDGITSTTTGALLTSAASHIIDGISLTCASGDAFDLNGTGSETCVYTNSFIVSCKRVGEISGWRTTVFRAMSVVAATDVTSGRLLFSGSSTAFNMDNSLWQGFAAGEMIDLGTATFDRIQIEAGSRFVVDSGITGIDGAASSANLNTGGEGQISGCLFTGAGTRVAANLDAGDIGWNHRDNSGIPDSAVIGCISLTSPTPTTISSTGVAVQMTGTTGLCSESERVVQSANNELQYIGLEPERGIITAEVSGTKAGGGGAVEYVISVYRDNVGGPFVQITDSDVGFDVDNKGRFAISSSIVRAKPDEKFQVWISNEDSTANFDAIHVKLLFVGSD